MTSAPSPFDKLTAADLAPQVAQVLGTTSIDVLDWHFQPFLGTYERTASGESVIFRGSGHARVAGDIYPWSLIVKLSSEANPSGGANPSDWNYWKRELEAYQSGLLTRLPAGIAAPRCYGITQVGETDYQIWLEDVRETMPVWSLERYGTSARHLGQFNGAYLSGYPLPLEHPWIGYGRTQEWLGFGEQFRESFPVHAQADVNRRWLSERSVKRVLKLWAQRHALANALKRLPRCLCHHDTHRGNLLARDPAPGQAQTVAIDWMQLGYGVVGQDIVPCIAANLLILKVDVSQASALDALAFAGYVEGLRESGWHGDRRLARLGYTATAALDFGLIWCLIYTNLLGSPETGISTVDRLANYTGHTFNEVAEQWAACQPYLLDLGDEATTLLDAI
jgi:hypothetical protein